MTTFHVKMCYCHPPLMRPSEDGRGQEREPGSPMRPASAHEAEAWWLDVGRDEYLRLREAGACVEDRVVLVGDPRDASSP